MAWLGWTEEQTLNTTVPSIVLACEGFIELQNMLHGNGEAPTSAPSVSMQPMSMPLFDALFGNE